MFPQDIIDNRTPQFKMLENSLIIR